MNLQVINRKSIKTREDKTKDSGTILQNDEHPGPRMKRKIFNYETQVFND